MIIGIVAISKNFAIGKDGKLPWHYSADLKFFKETTTDNAIVMGANTWRAIGRPLPNRLNIVLSRSGNVEVQPQVIKLTSKDEVLALSEYLTRDVYIIGGAKTYDAFEDVIDKWLVTDIPLTIDDADTFLPADLLDRFDQTETIDLGDGLAVRVLYRV